VESDPNLEEEAGIIHNVLTQMSRYKDDRQQNAGQKWKLPPNGQPICLFSGNTTAERTIIRPDDDSE
jgi:Rap guanine nucleotide exchange factor 4